MEDPGSRAPTGANSSNACMCLDAFVPPLTWAKQLPGGDVKQWSLTATPAFMLHIRPKLKIDDVRWFQFMGINYTEFFSSNIQIQNRGKHVCHEDLITFNINSVCGIKL